MLKTHPDRVWLWFVFIVEQDMSRSDMNMFKNHKRLTCSSSDSTRE